METGDVGAEAREGERQSHKGKTLFHPLMMLVEPERDTTVRGRTAQNRAQGMEPALSSFGGGGSSG